MCPGVVRETSKLIALIASKSNVEREKELSSDKINCFMGPKEGSLYHNMKTTVALFRRPKTPRFLERPQYSSAYKMLSTTV